MAQSEQKHSIEKWNNYVKLLFFTYLAITDENILRNDAFNPTPGSDMRSVGYRVYNVHIIV